MKVLLGNTFPQALVRRMVLTEPISMDEAKYILQDRGFVSFWGHANTFGVAEEVLGVSVKTLTDRPAISLNERQFPSLDGVETDTVIILSPNYRLGYRPAIGEEAKSEDILGWQCLKMWFADWETIKWQYGA